MGHSNSLISLLKLPGWLKITSQRYSFIEGIASNKWRVISLSINVVVFMLMDTLMVSPSLPYCHFALSSFHSTKGAISFHVTRQIVQRISETLLSILSKEQLHPCWNYKEKCLIVWSPISLVSSCMRLASFKHVGTICTECNAPMFHEMSDYLVIKPLVTH